MSVAPTPPATSDADSAPAVREPATVRKPKVNFEEQVRAATAGIKAGQTPSQIKAGLLGAGVDPLTSIVSSRA